MTGKASKGVVTEVTTSGIEGHWAREDDRKNPSWRIAGRRESDRGELNQKNYKKKIW